MKAQKLKLNVMNLEIFKNGRKDCREKDLVHLISDTLPVLIVFYFIAIVPEATARLQNLQFIWFETHFYIIRVNRVCNE
jgi:hypothetical protein